MAYRTKQVAAFLEVSPALIQKWANRGKIKAKKHADNYHLLFEKEDIAEFLMKNPDKRQVFLAHQPDSTFKDSYDILKKEVKRQYDDLWKC